MKNRKPAWWQLYLIPAVMFGLLLAWHLAHPTLLFEETGDLAVVVLTFGGMLAWVVANTGSLQRYYNDRDGRDEKIKITVYEPVADREKNPAFPYHTVRLESTREASPIDSARGHTEGEEHPKWPLS